MTTSDSDPKLAAILASAGRAFAAYGFRKTSMDDIAQGAGMSRPALYLHFRNKEDIFRSLAQVHYDAGAEAVQAALAAEGSVADRIAAAFAAQGGEVAEMMLTSPHGGELMDTGFVTAKDIAEAGEARLTGLYADWLAREAKAGRVRLTGPALEVAAAITAALKGAKTTAADYPSYLSRIAHLAALFGAGLTAAKGA